MVAAIYFSGHPDITSDGTGGYSSHIRGMVGGLAGLGVHVTTLVGGDLTSKTRDAPGTDTNELQAGSSILRSAVRGSTPSFVWNALRDARLIRSDNRMKIRLERLVEVEEPMFIYERHAHLHTGCLRVARSNGVRHVLEVNSPPDERASMGGFSPFDRPALRRTLDLVEHTDAALFVSSALMAHYECLLGTAIPHGLVVPNAIDPELIEAVAEERRIRRSDGPIIGFVGSLLPWHGIDLLMEAFAKVSKEFPLARLVIVGDGERRAELEATSSEMGLSDVATFTGAVSHETALREIAEFDVAVMVDSNWYGSPMKLFEYASLGCAIVAPDVLPAREVLEPGSEAIFVRPEVTHIANALSCLLRDEGLRHRLGAAARSRVLGENTWERAAAKVLAAVSSAEGP